MGKTSRGTREPEDEISRRVLRAIAKRDEEWNLFTSQEGNVFESWATKDVRNLCYYLGYQRPDYYLPSAEPFIVDNIIKRCADVRISALAQAPSRIRIYPKVAEARVRAMKAQQIGQHEWDTCGIPEEWDAVRRDKMIFGFGVLMLAWRFKEVEDEEALIDEEIARGDTPGAYVERMGDGAIPRIVHMGYNPETGETEERVVGSVDSELKAVTLHDDLFVRSISATNVFFDPLETDIRTMRNSRYICWREYKTYQELEDDPDVDKDILEAAQFAPAEQMLSTAAGIEPSEDAEDVLEVYYYLGTDPDDPDTTLLQMRCGTNHNDILKSVEWPFLFWPFVVRAERPVPGMVYPPSIVDECIADQDDVNDCLTEQYLHRKRFRDITYVDSDAIADGAFKNRVRMATWGEFVPVRRPTNASRISDAFYSPDTPNIPLDIYRPGREAAERIRVKFGVTEYQFGLFPSSAKSPTESMNYMNQASVRAKDDADEDRKARTRAVRLLMQTVVGNAKGSVPRSYAFLGEGGNKNWGEYSIEDLKGDFDIQIESVDNSSDQLGKIVGLSQALMQYTEAGRNPQTGKLIFDDPDYPGMPIVKNVRPIVERLIMLDESFTPGQLLEPTLEQQQLQEQLMLQKQKQMQMAMEQGPPAMPIPEGGIDGMPAEAPQEGAPPMPPGLAEILGGINA